MTVEQQLESHHRQAYLWARHCCNFEGEPAIKKFGQAGKDGIVEITIKEEAVQKYIKGN